MTWRLDYTADAKKQLKKLDRRDRETIASWMHRNIDGCEDPKAHGHVLHYDKRNLWRYRVGKYRVICEIRDSELLVLAVEVGHRSSIYR